VALGSKDRTAVKALTKAALEDKTALVREAAVIALPKVDAEAAKSVLAKVAAKDSEPRVRAAAGGSKR
jgi:HEAT repeat protein